MNTRDGESSAAESAANNPAADFRNLVESLPRGIILVDTEGVLLYSNPSAVSLFPSLASIAPFASLFGRIYELGDYISPLEEAIRAGRKFEFTAELSSSKKLQINLTPLVHNARELVIIINGVSAGRGDADEGQMRAQKIDELSTRSRTIFHDFNNAMAGILSTVNYYRQFVLPAGGALSVQRLGEHLALIGSSAERALDLVRQLRTMFMDRQSDTPAGRSPAGAPSESIDLQSSVNLPPIAQDGVTSAENHEKPPQQYAGECVLVADVESILRGAMRRSLEAVGFTVIEAVDGDDALKRFHEHTGEISLVILDMMMSKKPGDRVYREMISVNSTLKAVLTSGVPHDEQVDELINENHVGFLQKPFRHDDILSAVSALYTGGSQNCTR